MPAMKNLVLLVNKKWNKVDLLTERMMMRTGNEGIKTSEPDHTVLSTGLIIGYIHLKHNSIYLLVGVGTIREK